jgi:hypothetical protein
MIFNYQKAKLSTTLKLTHINQIWWYGKHDHVDEIDDNIYKQYKVYESVFIDYNFLRLEFSTKMQLFACMKIHFVNESGHMDKIDNMKYERLLMDNHIP